MLKLKERKSRGNNRRLSKFKIRDCLGFVKEHFLESIILITIIATIIGIIFIVIAGIKNEQNRIDEGYIIDKHYSAEYITVSYEKVGDMTVTRNNYHPEKFTLTIQGDKDGETVTYTFVVPKSEYSRYSIGDYYTR